MQKHFQNINSDDKLKIAEEWNQFLIDENFNFSSIEKIDMGGNSPLVYDKAGNKFSIDFVNNRTNYAKKKSTIKSELIAKALGSGRLGLRVLDLSAGLGIDAIFLAQLGFEVLAVERNPLIYLCLKYALAQTPHLKLQFVYGDSVNYLKTSKNAVDVIYFDPMFPDKSKSALPRQEMVFFKNLVGADDDAAEVLTAALNFSGAKRVVVKRPIKAPPLQVKVQGQVSGKLIRFDFYGGKI